MKQNQVVALVQGRKKQATDSLTNAHHVSQKVELFAGQMRTYHAKTDDGSGQGEQLPPESKRPSTSVTDLIASVRASVVSSMDTVLTQDIGNTLAKADVNAGSGSRAISLKGVPVTHLLFLEKTLTDLGTFIEKLPTLDPAEVWSKDASTGFLRSETRRSVRTKKVKKALVLLAPTAEHPGQAVPHDEDVPVGEWESFQISGAISITEKKNMLSRLTELKEAVISAREDANKTEIEWKKEGEQIFDFIFGA